MTEWHSPHGSGNAPIGPRDIIDIADEPESHLKRADRAFLFVQTGDFSVIKQPSAESQHETP